MATKCNVCGAEAQQFAKAQILHKYNIKYFQCSECRFVQTETPYWLDEAYESAIADIDVGLVCRNERFAKISSRLLNCVFPQFDSAIDYGGGYGMMTRMMRDRGHNFLHQDPHCENLFAKGFEVGSNTCRFDLLTAFEVWEHLAEPMVDIQRMDGLAETWLISTELIPDSPPEPNEWWYYVLDSGQHVSLWSKQAMQFVAEKYNRQYLSLGGCLHLFSTRPVNKRWARWLVNSRASRMMDIFRKRQSLVLADFKAAKKSFQNGVSISS